MLPPVAPGPHRVDRAADRCCGAVPWSPVGLCPPRSRRQSVDLFRHTLLSAADPLPPPPALRTIKVMSNQLQARFHELFAEAATLPVDERTALIDLLLDTLDPEDPAVQVLWLDDAERRLEEARAEEVELVPMPDLFRSAKRELAN